MSRRVFPDRADDISQKRKSRQQRRLLDNGAGDRIRTYDLRITNAPLYQLSYTGTERGSLGAKPVRVNRLAQCAALWAGRTQHPRACLPDR